MLVGIDLGPKTTKIAYRQEGKWHYHNVAPFLYEADDSNTDEEKVLTSYLIGLSREIDFNSLLSAVISYPNYWNLSRRRTLYKACQAAFSDRIFSLLPEPVAALMGHESTRSLCGDILIVELHENMASFSLLTVIQAGQDICLEIQLPLAYHQPVEPALQDFIINHLQPRAKQLGFFEAGSWRLKAVVLVGEETLLHQAASLVNSIFTPRELIIPVQADFQIARGLAEWAAGGEHCRVKAIYPFEFVQETFSLDSADHQFEPLPFDTNNLAMDLKARYLITTLTTGSLFNLSTGNHTLHYRLWERPGGQTQDNSGDRHNHLIWEFEDPNAYIAEPLGVYLHMGEFAIESDTIGQTSMNKPAPYDLNSDYLKLAQRLLAIPFLNEELKRDLQELASQPEGYDLTNQLELTRLRLLAFLQLY